MKEKILEAFKTLGFEMEELEDFGYGFCYEGKKYLYLPNEEDEEFLNLAIPSVWDEEDEELISRSELNEKINSTLKYVKAYKMVDSIWLVYERALLSDEDLEPVIAHMIIHLDGAHTFLCKQAEEARKDDDEEEDIEDENTDVSDDSDEA